mmetsp:Transcript_60856/g.145055  ORF Transcript_60856/g.145055 Transcript_60856/m.145055 type:complete len:96 (+) Transcript_60856:428-715(+)
MVIICHVGKHILKSIAPASPDVVGCSPRRVKSRHAKMQRHARAASATRRGEWDMMIMATSTPGMPNMAVAHSSVAGSISATSKWRQVIGQNTLIP